MAARIAKRGLLSSESVEMVTRSAGRSYAHVDHNDTGAGGEAHTPSTWGKEDLEAAGFNYIYGAEGLADGRHRGEPLLHMVMIISYKCTSREAQMLLGMDEGDSTCYMTFPPEDRPDLKHDEYRIHIYGCDYSYYLHGNPKEERPPAADDSWAFRIAPYGTSHLATWAAIVKAMTEKEPAFARDVMRSLLEEPGSDKLGINSARARRVHGDERPGLGPAELPADMREGQHARLVALGATRSAAREVASGLLLSRPAKGGGNEWWVGNVRFDSTQHAIEVSELPSRRSGV